MTGIGPDRDRDGTGPAPNRDDAGAVDRWRWHALAVCLVAGFMTLLDVSIVNVALPSIRDGLHASQSELQWVLSGYALTFGLILVPSGRFGDARGRRNVFVAGVGLFTLASAGAGVAPTAGLLVAARLIQGVAGGIINPQVTGLIQQLFRPQERGRPFGLLGATIGISTAIGPLLGGALIELGGAADGWRWVFYVNVPVGVAAIVLAFRFIPKRASDGLGRASDGLGRESDGPTRAGEQPEWAGDGPTRAGEQPERAGDGPTRAGEQPERAGSRRRESLDPVGVSLLGAGVVLLLLPLVQEQEWHGWIKWLLVPAGLAVLAAFTWWERRYARGSRPVVDLTLFGRRSYALGSVVALVYFGGFTAIFFVFTLYLQSGLRYSALLAGLSITPFALGSAGAAALGGRVVNRYGRPLVALGLAAVAIGLGASVLAVDLVPGRSAALATAAPLLVAGIGSGLVVAPNQTLTLAEVPVDRAGSAGGVLQTGQRIGSAIGIAGVGSVFFATVGSTHGNWARAYREALLVAIAFVVVALVAALVDVWAGHRAERRAGHRAERRAGHRAERRAGHRAEPDRSADDELSRPAGSPAARR